MGLAPYLLGIDRSLTSSSKIPAKIKIIANNPYHILYVVFMVISIVDRQLSNCFSIYCRLLIRQNILKMINKIIPSITKKIPNSGI